jgi:transposase
VDALVDQETLLEAEAEALDCGVATHEVLLAAGAVSERDYACALARALGLPLAGPGAEITLTDARARPLEMWLPAPLEGRPCRVLSASEAPPDSLQRLIADMRAQGLAVVLAPQSQIDAAIERQVQAERIDLAVRGLLHAQPASSAAAPFATWRRVPERSA